MLAKINIKIIFQVNFNASKPNRTFLVSLRLISLTSACLSASFLAGKIREIINTDKAESNPVS